MASRAVTKASDSVRALLAELRGGRASSINEAVLAWAAWATREYPWRHPGRSSYDVLIAELLLRRTTASAVAKVYDAFLRRFPSVQALHGAPDGDLEEMLSSLGLQRLRARGLKAMAAYLIENEGGQVPGTIDRLLRMPHVGSYTAAALLALAFERPTAMVDSNAERVLRRLFRFSLTERSTTRDLQLIATALLPREGYREFSLALLDLGALVCRYDRPRCDDCPLAIMCDHAYPPAGRESRDLCSSGES